jgi:hypothetical protein
MPKEARVWQPESPNKFTSETVEPQISDALFKK